MSHNNDGQDLDGHIDWVVFDRSWGTLSEDCITLEEARELADRTGGGPIFRRQWVREHGEE